jgi:hypothetical protein
MDYYRVDSSIESAAAAVHPHDQLRELRAENRKLKAAIQKEIERLRDENKSLGLLLQDKEVVKCGGTKTNECL